MVILNSGRLSRAAQYGNTSKIDFNDIKIASQGRWHEILGSFIDSAFLTGKHCACPVCGGKDRFRFDDRLGSGSFFCNNCGSGDGFKLFQLIHDWSFPKVLQEISKLLHLGNNVPGPKHVSYYLKKLNLGSSNDAMNAEEIAKRRNRLNHVWKYSIPVQIGDPVDLYLRQRNIELSQYPECLRYHAAMPYFEGKRFVSTFPTMLAMVKDPSGKPITVHRTFLTFDGKKAPVEQPKKLMSATGKISGSAIPLFKPTNDILAVAEGIETAISFYIGSDIPTWATISANGMEKVIVPSEIKEVVIAYDHDDRGKKAALILSERLLSEGRRVKRVAPPVPGSDFNNLLQEALR